MFGRAFDGTVTGPGNLFLPPRGVDPRLCGVDPVSARAHAGGGAGGGDGARRLRRATDGEEGEGEEELLPSLRQRYLPASSGGALATSSAGAVPR